MRSTFSIIFATAALATVAFGQTSNSNDGFYHVGFAANLNIGDSVIDMTNDGYNGGPYTGGNNGNICANVYVMDPDGVFASCCSCLVRPDNVVSLSVNRDLTGNTANGVIPNSVVIKILTSEPANGTTCNPATAGTTRSTPLEYGLMAWGTTIHANSTTTPTTTYEVVNTPFQAGQLAGMLPSVNAGGPFITTPIISSGYLRTNGLVTIGTTPAPGSELADLTATCQFVQSTMGGAGICASCRLGALTGAKQ